ncbi:tyrosine-type recombinase/integrase [Polycladomyces subterraneus]|uniref:tyrosine-type recombinase/integrase n=1 Tax=Polycladomyces subterraneus TaxID=1016997 RepID=UPI003425E8CF
MLRRRTPAKKSAEGIYVLDKVKIGKVDQWVMIRGTNKSHPVLLFLHGGPGAAQIGFARPFKKLEVSEQAQGWIDRFVSDLEAKEDLSPKTLKEYASDLRHIADWFEATWNSHREEETLFHPAGIATKTLIRYREYMHLNQNLKLATINRRLNTVKRFFDWAQQTGVVKIDVADAVKLVPEEKTSPQQMTDKEEADLVAAVQQHGSLRGRTIILLMLHTGLRTMEVCNLNLRM